MEKFTVEFDVIERSTFQATISADTKEEAIQMFKENMEKSENWARLEPGTIEDVDMNTVVVVEDVV